MIRRALSSAVSGAVPAAVPLAAVLLAFALPAAAPAQDGQALARDYRETHGPEILRDYAELLSIPNVARDSINIRRNADYLRDRLQALGVESELLTLRGAPPVVWGRIDVGADRTLGLYVHYDGQPVDPTKWTHAPWEPVLYTRSMEAGGEPIPFPEPGYAVDPEWRIYARSAGDDKAPLGALFPVLEAFREEGVEPTSNIVFWFEGEEEAGSPHLEDYLRAYRDRIDDIDLWLFFDGPIHQSGRPQLTFGVRGVTGLEVTVYGPSRSLHSGHYGNWAPVPGNLLAHLIAGMKAEDGTVLIDGFYDTVEPIGPQERAALRDFPHPDEQLKRELGLTWTEGEPQTLAERLLLPSLTIRGLASGNTGALARNVIPSTATATLGVRLVKGNDPEHMLDLVEAHIREQGYHIVREDPDNETRLAHDRVAKVVRRGSGYPAARTRMDLPVVQDVIGAARAASAGRLVLKPSSGGSLPLYLFTQGLGKPAIMVPIANHDDNQHAPDENLKVWNLWYGIELYGALLTMP